MDRILEDFARCRAWATKIRKSRPKSSMEPLSQGGISRYPHHLSGVVSVRPPSTIMDCTVSRIVPMRSASYSRAIERKGFRHAERIFTFGGTQGTATRSAPGMGPGNPQEP
jgi:hypothetical protein